MLPTNLTALDFEDIKSSIKSYLRTRSEFSDYEFEGSALSYMIDILAYNTYYVAFNANMSMNEAFLASATVRDNVVNIVKALNYTPKSVTAAYCYLHLQVQTQVGEDGTYPNNITLITGPTAQGGNFIWNRLDPMTTEVNQTTGIGEFRCVKLMEGSIVNFSYSVNTFARQRYVIPNDSVDTSTLKVSVRDNKTSTISNVFNKVENVTGVQSIDRIYFLSETEDMRYEIFFGDGVIGSKLGDGQVIDLEYLVTSGEKANGVKSFSFIGNFIDSNGNEYDVNETDYQIAEYARFGDKEETIEEIKYSAPRWYSAQYRAVTTQDYETIVKKIYPNTKTVVAFGGDSLYPAIYGKVFIAIKTKTGSKLNSATKLQIANDLKPYAIASIQPVVVDADSIFINSKIFITYDPACSSRSVSAIGANAQNAITQWASQTGINNFNGQFSLAKLQKAVSNSDRCIANISTQISLVKYVKPDPAQTNTYCVSTGSPIYDSAPGGSNTGDAAACKKEPVIRSSRFRTLDRPDTDQYFEDDGYGNLIVYYSSGNRKIVTNDKGGTVDYKTGQICFGPVSIIGAGNNILPVNDGVVDTSVTATSSIGQIQIAVQIIPSNNSVIITPTPSTVFDMIVPVISINPIGTTLPSSIPLNSLTPSDFEITPPTIVIPDIANNGDIAGISCF